MNTSEAKLEQFRSMFAASRCCVVFSGAGISTESGIPDFRSPGGIWSKVKPVQFQDFLKSEDKRREYWRQKFVFDNDLQNARPNSGHQAISRLIRQGRASV